MFSWEIDNCLINKNYKLTHSEVREIMIKSPQVNHFKLEELKPSDEYSVYHWWTDDGYEWTFKIKNENDNKL